MVNNVVACSCAKCLGVISKSSYIFHTFLPSIALGRERQYSVVVVFFAISVLPHRVTLLVEAESLQFSLFLGEDGFNRICFGDFLLDK